MYSLLKDLVTVNEYVPGLRPGIEVVVVFPDCVILPGFIVRTHDPDGSEFRATLPVAIAHVGCVIVPICGGVGVHWRCIYYDAGRRH